MISVRTSEVRRRTIPMSGEWLRVGVDVACPGEGGVGQDLDLFAAATRLAKIAFCASVSKSGWIYGSASSGSQVSNGLGEGTGVGLLGGLEL